MYNSTEEVLTSSIRFLFEKLIIAQLIKEFPAFMHLKVYFRAHNSLDPILRLLNPIHSTHPF